jgi:hypothetical protein
MHKDCIVGAVDESKGAIKEAAVKVLSDATLTVDALV